MVVAVHHAAQPLVVDGHTVEVGEHDEVVLRRLDAHRERELLAVEEVKVLLELHWLHPRLPAFQVFQVFLGFVVGAVVHDNNLKIRVILVEQNGNQFGKVFVGIAGTKHNGRRLQFFVEFRACVPLVEGDFRKQGPMEVQLNDKANAKDD